MISVPMVSVLVLVEVRAEVEDRAHREHAEELDRREEDREDPLDVRRLRPVRVVERVELGLEAAFAVERLHDCHARHRLGDLRRDGGDPVPLLDVRRVRDPLEPAREDERRRQDDERDEPEAPVGDEERDDRRRQEDDVRDEGRHPLREDVGDRVDVARETRDDPARLLLREVAEREAGEVVEEVPPQADHDPPGRSSRARG